MCGIAGFNFENKILLKKMCDLIEHRGPDDFGYYTDLGVSIGMRRLSIIDLISGHQPQHNENENIWIVFNGEIYNFRELRNILKKNGHQFYTNSDTEVIVHAYEEWGENCVNRFRGQFSFCIYDKIKEIFFIARDHLGLKPLYYYFDGNRFIFGSEIKSILCHDIKRELNEVALSQYISLRYVPFNLTLFKNIFKLPSSSYLKLNLKIKKIEIKKYWKITYLINQSKSAEFLANELKKLLEESVKIRMISDVPLGAFLSGGIDSSAIVGLMSQFSDEPIKTYSIGFEQGARVNETKYAKIVSDHFNTNHTELLIKSTCFEILPQLAWHFDDLIADAAVIPIYFMAKLAKEKITVALTGDGADEVFAGYSVDYKFNKEKYMNYIPRSILDFIMKFYRYVPFQTIRMAFSYINNSKTSLDRFLRAIMIVSDEEKAKVLPNKNEPLLPVLKKVLNKDLDIINKSINYDLCYQLPNLYNMKIDKMSMAASLEVRVPFLDKKIVEWASTVPSSLKLKDGIEKYILRLALKDLLPYEILKRKKQGFGTPIDLWFKKGMKDLSDEIFDRLMKRDFLFNSKYIKTIKKRRFNRYFGSRAWMLIFFELWYETFIENEYNLKPIKL